MKKIILQNDSMKVEFDTEKGMLCSMKDKSGENSSEYLLDDGDLPQIYRERARGLGHLALSLSSGRGECSFRFGGTDGKATVRKKDNGVILSSQQDSPQAGVSLKIMEEFHMSEDGLLWKITLENTGSESLEIREMKIPLPMNQYFRYDDEYKYEKCVLRHSCMCGNNAWIYWQRSSGDGPVLIMKAMEDTCLDYYEIGEGDDAGKICEPGKAFEGICYVLPYYKKTPFSSGRERVESLGAGKKKSIGFLFAIIPEFARIKQWLAEHGGFYAEAKPAMTVPKGEPCNLVIYSSSVPKTWMENPEDCCKSIETAGKYNKISIVLNGYGRRKIYLDFNGIVSELELFGIEKPADIYRKQAEFITDKQFETDIDDPCFHGILMWDMYTKCRINSKCNPHGPDWYAGGSDEIGLVSGLFLSEKNRYFPEKKEIYVLKQYCEDFIEKRLTEMPGYKVHRMVPWFTMFDDWKGKGADDVWRAFNYIHVINTFYNMYKISQTYELPFLERPEVYLKKAWNYAMAMFRYWMFPDGVGAAEYGNMGEHMLVLDLLPSLKQEGFEQEALELERKISEKAAFFAGKKYPYGSEMAYDSTAYEAVYAYGKYLNDSRVMKGTADVVLANRGKNPVWYLYFTDLRQMGESQWNVSYMTQLGAWTLYDWTLEQRHYDEEMIRSWFASYLAGFSIYNSGGYWSDDSLNEGASTWIIHGQYGDYTGFVNGEPVLKGAVGMSGESALGYFGALKSAASVVMKDKEGSEICYGCVKKTEEGQPVYYPEDGLNMRFFQITEGWAVKLYCDGIKKAVCNKQSATIHIEKRKYSAFGIKFQFRSDRKCKCIFLTDREKKIVEQDASGWILLEMKMETPVVYIERIFDGH